MFSRIRSVIHRGLFFAALFFVLPPLAADEWVVNGEHGFYSKRSPELTLAPDGTPVVAFYDGEGHILVRRKGQAPTVLNDDAKSGNPSGLALATLGEDVIAVWRERRKKGQTLVSRRSSDGGATWESVTLIDRETQPLTRIRIGRDGAGNLHILWLGQRRDGEPDRHEGD